LVVAPACPNHATPDALEWALAESRAWIERLEEARATLYAAFRRRSEIAHELDCGGRATHPFADCPFMGCRSDQATLRMGNPRRKTPAAALAGGSGT
jgi:hypothetical protein